MPPACLDYVNAGLPEAFKQTGNQWTTLSEYLKSIIDTGSLDYFTALTGCGVTAISSYGLGSSTVVFGDDGALIGFDLLGDTEFGPCETGGYRRGTVPPDGCSSGYHACDIAPDVLDTGVVCDCPCPSEPPPRDHVETSNECVASALAPACAATYDEELSNLDAYGGWVEGDCGHLVTMRSILPLFGEDEGPLTCVYAGTGALVGAARLAPDAGECAGVSSWSYGTLPNSDCLPTDVCWRGPSTESPDGTPLCSPQ